MNPLITRTLDDNARKFDEFAQINEFYLRGVNMDKTQAFLNQSSLDILAAVREVVEGMKKDGEYGMDTRVFKGTAWARGQNQRYNQALKEILTALSEGKENI